MTDPRPVNCRFRLMDEGRPHPRSSCESCGRGIATGLGRECHLTARPHTATESILDFSDRSMDERALHDTMKRFTERWSPKDRRDAGDFHADLIILMQAVHRDAMRPINVLLQNPLNFMPPLVHVKPEMPGG